MQPASAPRPAGKEGPAAQVAGSLVERGMVLMTAGVVMAPGVHAIAKGLGDSLAPGQIAWARFFFQLLFLLPLVWITQGGRIPRPSLAQALRGLLMAAAALFFFWALTYLPLADAAAIFFVEPLLLTLMAALFLGEPIGWRRGLAVIVGFLGALVVIRPSFEAVGPAALLPLLAAACFASYLAITRRLAAAEDARAMQFWVCAFASLVLLLALGLGARAAWPVLQPAWPTPAEWGLLLGLGVIATASHMLAIQALRLAPAGILAPFQYLEILGATLLGVIFFADLPDGTTLLGITIIVGAGLYVFRRERSLARQRSGRSLR